MNLITLKVTLLIVGVLVNSNSIPDCTPVKSYILKNRIFRYLNISQPYQQVALSAWKQGEQIPNGTYTLYLVVNRKGGSNLKRKLGEIDYKGTEHKKWNKIPTLKWVVIPTNIDNENSFNKWSIRLRGINIGNKKLVPSLAHNWIYKIFVKDKDVNVGGIRDFKNSRFCRDISTVGSTDNLKL